jgi:putative FmdB family regulatory protein
VSRRSLTHEDEAGLTGTGEAGSPWRGFRAPVDRPTMHLPADAFAAATEGALAIYEYLCELDGVFELSRPMGTAPEAADCPHCGTRAVRIVSAPRIVTTTRSAWSVAMDRAAKSAHEPDVVSSVPSAGARPRIRNAPMTPALARLPRP